MTYLCGSMQQKRQDSDAKSSSDSEIGDIDIAEDDDEEKIIEMRRKKREELLKVTIQRFTCNLEHNPNNIRVR